MLITCIVTIMTHHQSGRKCSCLMCHGTIEVNNSSDHNRAEGQKLWILLDQLCSRLKGLTLPWAALKTTAKVTETSVLMVDDYTSTQKRCRPSFL